jgi:hypothetical protein
MTTGDKSADIAVHDCNAGDGLLSTGRDIKEALSLDLRQCPWSRVEVCGKLSTMLGREITEATLDAFTAESKQGHRFPADLIAPWVRVTGSRRLLDLLCQWCGFHVADAIEHGFAELGRAQIESEKADAKLKALKGELWQAR